MHRVNLTLTEIEVLEETVVDNFRLLSNTVCLDGKSDNSSIS